MNRQRCLSHLGAGSYDYESDVYQNELYGQLPVNAGQSTAVIS